MRYAIIQNDVVVDLSEAPSGWTDPDGLITVASDVAMIGWKYDGANLVAPAAEPVVSSVDELLLAASGHQNALLAGTWTFVVHDAKNAEVALTTRLDDRGQASMTQLAVWSAIAPSGDTEPYSNVDYSSTEITTDMARELALLAGRAKSSTYAALNAIAASILADPPGITTVEQVLEHAAWPRQ